MRLVFVGSSLLSSYWNGAATYYRGVLRALAERGYAITFLEPDVLDRQAHRDIEPPDWCRVVVYPPTDSGVGMVAAEAAAADIVVKASGVGFADDLLLETALGAARPDALRIWWDVDAPATLSTIAADPDHPLRRALHRIVDLILTYGGGPKVVEGYRKLAPLPCTPVHNALDPGTHHPVPPLPRFLADLSLLANRLPDREARIEAFFLLPAALLQGRTFILGGAGWDDKPVPANVARIGHVPTCDHNAFNASALAVLNVNRASMAATGFSPPTRVFEAAGAAACIITDEWPGIETFLAPGREILVARDGGDVAEILEHLTPAHSRAIGEAARRRVLAQHTYERRALDLDAVLRSMVHQRRAEAAA